MAQARFSVNIGASGSGTVHIRTDSMVPWVIHQITIENSLAPTGATADIRIGNIGQPIADQALVTPMLPRTDTAVEPPAVTLDPTQEVTVNWYNAPNTFGRVWIDYDEGTG
jgi:hypothetical protein